MTDEQMSRRLVLATQATAERSIHVINAAIKDLRTNLDKPKTDQWRDETMRTINQLRDQSLDGTQAQFLAQHITREEQNKMALAINNKSIDAKKALYSNPSPLLGAYAFSERASDFITLVEQAKEQMVGFIQTQGLHEKAALSQSPKSNKSQLK